MPNNSISAQDMLILTLSRLFQKLPRMKDPRLKRTLGARELASKDPRLMSAIAQLGTGDMMIIADRLKGNRVLHELGLDLSYDRENEAFILQPATSIVTVNLP